MEVMEVLLRRSSFVEAFAEGQKDKRTLVEELSCSRSTVDRSIRELETLGVAECVDGKYCLTPFGEMARTAFADFEERLDQWFRFAPFLQWLPHDELGLDVELLADADLYLPEPGDPWAMVNRHVTVAAQASEMRLVLPLTGLHAHRVIRERIVDAGAQATVVTTSEVVHTYQSDDAYAPLTEEMAETERYALYQYDDPVPCFVGLLDGTVQIGVDDGGEPKALVEGESPALREWAEATIDEFERAATPVVTAAEPVEH
ncbi:Predicted transcriptional regulator, contains HTH domain [Halogranum amylolyticum]|uniref:Predicted transcriptional regulator, contains HTH domain n=2 Tax=Halogranum amylolyticum TaxID=660520 RepID=A0A1H8S4B8_9EURY|nr:Predicted transcriptional regulator, contains HTH domain [Halogranum amylolyticum]